MIVISVILALLIVLSAFFSASETAFFSLGGVRLRKLKNYSRAKKIRIMLKNPGQLLSAIVLGNMLANIGLASLSTVIFVKLFKNSGAIISIIFSGTVILFVGEVLPKTLSIYFAEEVSTFVAPIIEFLLKAFYPAVFILQRCSNAVSSLFTKAKRGVYFTEGELETALILGRKGGAISKAEKEMIQHALKFKDTSASQIMTPRVDVKAIDLESSRAEVLELLKKERHSKFPIYKESIDNIRGILWSKVAFLSPDEKWNALVKEAMFIPETKKIDDILTDFIKKGERIAIVLDEHGGTSGIVTFEDIVEEIFGELYDEYEFPQKLIEKISEQLYRVSANISVKTINLELGIDLPEYEGSTAGFILSYLERIPQQGEKFKFNNVEFSIERATRKRILSVIVKLL